jgi:hypothetical protein
MANTYVDYTAVATQTDYNFSFEYLRDEHVKVKVNGSEVTNFTIVTSPTPTKVRFDTAPVANADIKIYRDSRGDFSPLVDFVDGSVLTENELDESYKHNLFIGQEASEGQGGEQLTKKGLEHYDAEGNKIINLFAPSDNTDAANKGYVDQTVDNAIALGGSPAIVSLGGYNVTSAVTAVTQSLANWTNTNALDVTATNTTKARSLADRFADYVNVLDFIDPTEHAAIADGTTTFNATSAIQACLDIGGRIHFPEGTYLCDRVFVLKPAYIDLNGSTIKRNLNTTKRIFQHGLDSGSNPVSNSGNLTIRNGILDGDNKGEDSGHLIQYDDVNANLVLENMIFQNNNTYAYDSDHKDTDHVYVLSAKSVRIDGCRFYLTSRNGVSFTDPVENIKITNCHFERCYLFGIDIEPNLPVDDDMYGDVVITGNTFLNNGNRGDGSDVWASSGTGVINCAPNGSDLTKLIVTNLTFSDNTATCDYTTAGGVLSPFFKLNQIRVLTVGNNTIAGVNSIQLLTGATTQDSTSLIVTGNKFSGDIGAGGPCDVVVFDGNNARGAIFNGAKTTIVSNLFSNPFDSDDICVKFASNVDDVNISSNHFKDATYVIDSSGTLPTLHIANNSLDNVALHNSGNTLPAATLLTNNTGGQIVAPTHVVSSSTKLTITSSTDTTVLDLANKNSAGLIAVIDEQGTRMGSFGMFGSFYDGTNTTSFLTNVQDSGLSGSALTITGNTIQFYHTFTPNREVTINVIYYFNN